MAVIPATTVEEIVIEVVEELVKISVYVVT